MGIGVQHCGCLTLVTFYLCDALPWQRLDLATPSLGSVLYGRRFLLATPRLGHACTWRRLT